MLSRGEMWSMVGDKLTISRKKNMGSKMLERMTSSGGEWAGQYATG